MNTRRRIAVVAAAVAASAGMTVQVAAAEVPDGPELVSADHLGEPAAEAVAQGQISDDGNRALFVGRSADDGSDLIRIRDRAAGTTETLFGADQPDDAYTATLSGNGSFVAVAMHIADLDQFELAVYGLDDDSVQFAGEYTYTGSPSLSDDGKVVAFVGRKAGQELPAIFATNLATGVTTRVTQPTAAATDPVVSGDGSTVAYRQYGHVYRRVVATAALTRIDVRPDGTFGAAGNAKPVGLSDDGKTVAFTSAATDLAAGTGACDDRGSGSGCVFSRDVVGAKTTVGSRAVNGTAVPAVNAGAALSGDGKVIAYDGVYQGRRAVYVHGPVPSIVRLASVNAADVAANAPVYLPSLSQDGSLVTFHSKASNFGYGQLPATQVWVARGR